jgi:hypothetical protein
VQVWLIRFCAMHGEMRVQSKWITRHMVQQSAQQDVGPLAIGPSTNIGRPPHISLSVLDCTPYCTPDIMPYAHVPDSA